MASSFPYRAFFKFKSLTRTRYQATNPTNLHLVPHLTPITITTTRTFLRQTSTQQATACIMSSTTTEAKTSSSTSSTTPNMSQISWSSSATTAARSNAADLLQSGWSLSHTKDGLEREYVFGGFAKAMEFMNQVAAQCRATRHHPEWANVYNIVRIRWTTHNPKGLSDKDIEMARFCDLKAVEVGAKSMSKSDWASKDGAGSVLETMIPAGSACGVCEKK
ncbi:pterin 4 alpha carbinolamine dehydratase-domain-containing protein [Pyronema omphalodes]|nr:pterin 4 alpha carbinolamine dehydratase-domain-containing protein [Pyronema omphalodes]